MASAGLRKPPRHKVLVISRFFFLVDLVVSSELKVSQNCRFQIRGYAGWTYIEEAQAENGWCRILFASLWLGSGPISNFVRNCVQGKVVFSVELISLSTPYQVFQTASERIEVEGLSALRALSTCLSRSILGSEDEDLLDSFLIGILQGNHLCCLPSEAAVKTGKNVLRK